MLQSICWDIYLKYSARSDDWTLSTFENVKRILTDNSCYDPMMPEN